jgi:small subunit ribosomal protein S21
MLMRINRKYKDESFESLMRRFKKGCEKSDIINEVKKREHFEKPSMSRRLKRKMAVKKELKRQEDQRLHRFPGK